MGTERAATASCGSCHGDGDFSATCGGGLRQRRPWQRDLLAGADRLERGVRAVCAGCDGHHAGDGPLGQGAPIVLNDAGTVITGSVGVTTYFTITLNPATGDVTFTQSNIWHASTQR